MTFSPALVTQVMASNRSRLLAIISQITPATQSMDMTKPIIERKAA